MSSGAPPARVLFALCLASGRRSMLAILDSGAARPCMEPVALTRPSSDDAVAKPAGAAVAVGSCEKSIAARTAAVEAVADGPSPDAPAPPPTEPLRAATTAPATALCHDRMVRGADAVDTGSTGSLEATSSGATPPPTEAALLAADNASALCHDLRARGASGETCVMVPAGTSW